MNKKQTDYLKGQFNVEYSKTLAEDIQKEILFNLKLSNLIAEKTRSNTILLIWLITIPLIVGILAAITLTT
jgi:hypothetical protein